MKRELVIEKLEALLAFQRQDLNNGSDYEDAGKVLEMLEELGMLLPNVCDVNGKWDDKKYIAHYYMGKNIHYWENE